MFHQSGVSRKAVPRQNRETRKEDTSLLGRLRRQLAQPMEGISPPTVWSTGLKPLDALLPDRGVRSGSIVEWLADDGSGASTLAWLTARHLQQQRSIVVIDPERKFFPPGAGHLGIDLNRVVVVRPAGAEALWAMEQSLRSEAGCVVIGRLDRLTQQAFRRLKLAAERGGGIGLFLRRLRCRHEPSWADVRLVVEAQPGGACFAKEDARFAAHLKCAAKRGSPTGSFARRVRLELLHVRGGGFRQRATVMSINDDACVVSVDSELARAATSSPAARAS